MEKHSLTTRMSIVKERFKRKQYMCAYEFAFGGVTKKQKARIANVWNLRIEDKQITENFEHLLKLIK